MYEAFTEFKQIGAASENARVDHAVRGRMEELEALGIPHQLEECGDDHTTLYLIHLTDKVATVSIHPHTR